MDFIPSPRTVAKSPAVKANDTHAGTPQRSDAGQSTFSTALRTKAKGRPVN